MKWAPIVMCWVSWASLLGCTVEPAADARATAAASEGWRGAESYSIGADGRTATIAFEPGEPTDGAALAIYTEFDSDCAGACCVQLESVTADNDEWVPAAKEQSQWGATCTGCRHRVTIGPGPGFFVFPNDGRPLGAVQRIGFRVGVRDCATRLPRKAKLGEAVPVSVRVWWRVWRPSEGSKQLPVRFAYTADAFAPDSVAGNTALAVAGLPALATWVDACLQPADVVVTARVEPTALPAVGGELRFGRGDFHELATVANALEFGILARSEGPPNLLTGPTVIFVPCLRELGLLGANGASAAGITPRIPGGAGLDAIFVATRTCFGDNLGGARYPHPSSLGRTVAHELGHYLGLHHTVGLGARGDDHLADTGPDNLMHPQPATASTCRITPMQAEVIRHHPALTFGGAGVFR